MILSIIILSLLLFISVIVIAVQKKLIKELKSNEKDEFNSPLAKLGIVHQDWNRTSDGKKIASNNVIIEVKAIQYSNGLSKVKVMNVSGAYDNRQAHDVKMRMPEFIKTSEITFVEPEEPEIKDEPFGIKA